jgi:uncharacterized coiled-coil protein SlyX
MAIDISDNTNYYRWDIGSTGNLQLDYQSGGNSNMATKLTVTKDGNITSTALVKTTDAQDTTDPVFVLADSTGKLVRGYANYTTLNNTIAELQSKVTNANSSVAQLIEMSNNLNAQTSGALSIINSYVQKNLDTQVTTLATQVSNQQNTISSLQNTVTQIGNLTGTTGLRSNANLFNYVIGLAFFSFVVFLIALLKKR